MRVVLGPAYEKRLDEAVDHLLDLGAEQAAQVLLDQAYGQVPDLLADSPRIGRDFLARNPDIPEVRAAWDTTRALAGDDIELREYIFGDYLVLYALHQGCIHLLTLRHHRQSGFDFSEA